MDFAIDNAQLRLMLDNGSAPSHKHLATEYQEDHMEDEKPAEAEKGKPKKKGEEGDTDESDHLQKFILV